MILRATLGRPALVGVALALAAIMAASAQPAPPAQPAQQGGAMNALQINRDQPVKIESNSLEVRDKSHQATFIGAVKLVQGDTTLKCDTLVVFYEDNAAPAPGAKKAKAPAPKQDAKPGAAAPGGQQIKRVEAKGNVFITQKDQTGAGELGVYDLKTNSITLTGNVVVTQGQNVLRGERMVVDMTTGITRVESSGKPGTRVEMLAQPSAAPGATPGAPPAPAPASPKDAKATPAPATPAPQAKTPAKPAVGAPTRIN
jgi:lipopolysaccharide export system protein LptA